MNAVEGGRKNENEKSDEEEEEEEVADRPTRTQGTRLRPRRRTMTTRRQSARPS